MSANGNGTHESSGGLSSCPTRVCPTRVAPGSPLISHRILLGDCERRQTDLYHRCWSCAFAHRFDGTALRAAAEAALSNGNGNGRNPISPAGDEGRVIRPAPRKTTAHAEAR